MMKKWSFYLLLFSFAIFLYSCSQEKAQDNRTVVRINDFALSLNEFQYSLAQELELDEDFKLTKEAKKEFIEAIIRKELLIQEAKRSQLDKKEKFIRTIERHWEATLIRNLMEMKGKEINRTILVSQDEIRSRYDEMKRTDKNLPAIAELEKNLMDDLKEEKKTKLMRQWIMDLRKKAKIKIDQKLLYKE